MKMILDRERAGYRVGYGHVGSEMCRRGGPGGGNPSYPPGPMILSAVKARGRAGATRGPGPKRRLVESGVVAPRSPCSRYNSRFSYLGKREGSGNQADDPGGDGHKDTLD